MALFLLPTIITCCVQLFKVDFEAWLEANGFRSSLEEVEIEAFMQGGMSKQHDEEGDILTKTAFIKMLLRSVLNHLLLDPN